MSANPWWSPGRGGPACVSLWLPSQAQAGPLILYTASFCSGYSSGLSCSRRVLNERDGNLSQECYLSLSTAPHRCACVEHRCKRCWEAHALVSILTAWIFDWSQPETPTLDLANPRCGHLATAVREAVELHGILHARTTACHLVSCGHRIRVSFIAKSRSSARCGMPSPALTKIPFLLSSVPSMARSSCTKRRRIRGRCSRSSLCPGDGCFKSTLRVLRCPAQVNHVGQSSLPIPPSRDNLPVSNADIPVQLTLDVVD